MGIELIDSNFIRQSVQGTELAFYDVCQPPFALSGLAFFSAERQFCRMPQASLGAQNSGVQQLAWHTAGAQLRFCSDSSVMALQVEWRSNAIMSHMPNSGQSGFDLYVGSGSSKRYVQTFIPPAGQKEYTGFLYQNKLAATGMMEATVNFPLYNGINSMRIGLLPEAKILPPPPFSLPKPLLFYGSSITQGGCASRPGNAYCQMIARRFDAECLNFGFSGNARGELAMAEVIASLDLAAFIYDYDHNAPTAEHLQETHAPFFQLIRQRRPELPVIMVSRPAVDLNPVECDRRKAIIKETYLQALAAGDRRVYFVDGLLLFGTSDRDACTVDGCHPNDLGFYRMAEAITPMVEKALGESGQLTNLK